MKLLVDMFPCQTPSRFRGIGRYTLSLTSAMANLRQTNDMTVLADPLYPETFNELRQEFIRLLPAGAYLPYYHGSLQNTSQQNEGTSSRISENLIHQAYRVVSPNVVLTPSLFEGWGGGEHGMVALPNQNNPSYQRVVILYDIIPYIFRDQYLDPNPAIKKWYLERVNLLNKFDLLLSISESTRQDAINILGIQPEKIVNISGAASSNFKKIVLGDCEKQNILHQFGITRPFVLYVGGNDFRKNMDGALRAFAQLPRQIIAKHQLVLNDVGDETIFRNKLRTLGLEDADVVIIRRTTDQELVMLYNLCKLFIFPSLYEGFGLPVLEAMSCGAPVIASNNSSLPEVVGRPDVLFDATNDQSVTASLLHVLMDASFCEELAVYGLGRAKQFSWEKSAQAAWDAVEKIQEEKKLEESRFAVSIPPIQSRMRIAYVSPLPPQQSGIADYSANLLQYLSKHFEIDLFSDSTEKKPLLFVNDSLKTYHWTELHERRDTYEAVVYHLGNSHFHPYMVDLLQEIPGVVVLHDFFLSNLPYVEEFVNGKKDGFFIKEMDYCHGLRGVVDALKNCAFDTRVEKSREQWPINWKALKYAQELIVHSKHQSELIKQFYARGYTPNFTLIKQVHETAPQISRSKKQELRKELGLDSNAFIFCSFGLMAPTKLNISVIRAFSQSLTTSKTNALLVFVGQLGESPHKQEVLKSINELNLCERISITGYINKEKYDKYLTCADAAIQLRTGSRGETSRAVLDCMAYGIPTIINAHGALDDYNAEDVIKLSDSMESNELIEAMILLQTDKAYCAEKSQRAQKCIIEQHDPDNIAANYANVIIRAAQMNERKSFAPLVDSIMQVNSPLHLLRSSSKYAAANLTLRCQPRILVELSGFEGANVRGDEKEAVSEIIKALNAINDKSIHIELVHSGEGQFLRAGRLAETIFELQGQSLGPDKPIIIQPGDILLMIDCLLSTANLSLEIFENIRQRGGKVITLANNFSETLLTTQAMESDMILCGSRETAENMYRAIQKYPIKFQHTIDIFYLSSDANIGVQKENNAIKHIKLAGLDQAIWEEIAAWMLNPLEGSRILNRFSNDRTETRDSVIQEELGESNKSEQFNFHQKQSTITAGLLKSCACSQSMLESVDF